MQWRKSKGLKCLVKIITKWEEQCRNWTVSTQNYIPPLSKSPLQCTLSSVSVCIHTCVHKERGRRETPRPGRFQFSPIAKHRWFIVFLSGWKGSKRPLLGRRWGLAVPWAADAQEAEALAQLLHRKRCPRRAPGPGRRPCPPTPAAYLRYGGFLAPRRRWGNLLLLFIA